MTASRLVRYAVLSVVCCGCASTPLHYYTLSRPLADSREPAQAACCKVLIKRLVIPAAVDRPELVIRSGDDQAVVLNNDAWLAPLREEIRDALRSDIDARLSKAPLATGTASRDYGLQIEVTRFESVPGQYVVVTADWRLQSVADRAASISCASAARIAVGNSVSAAVHGYQQAIGNIADQLAVNVLSANGSGPQRCRALNP